MEKVSSWKYLSVTQRDSIPACSATWPSSLN